MLNTFEQRSKLKLTATIVTVLVIAGLVVVADHLKSTNKSSGLALQTGSSTASIASPSPASTSSDSASSNTAASSSSSSNGYKDGTFTATSSYYVPHGQEEIQVNLTLSGGTITNASIQNSENDNASARYQEGFAAEYKSYVIGKKISSLQLDVISGASDTTQGFNEALQKIATEAQA